MKAVEEMSDEELRIEIAEFCGWDITIIEEVYEMEAINPKTGPHNNYYS
jgi:hypothetical protein